MEDKQRRKSSDSGTYRIRPAHVSTKNYGNGVPMNYGSGGTCRNSSNMTSRNGPTSLGNVQSGEREARNGVHVTDGSACRPADAAVVTKSVKSTSGSGGCGKLGAGASAAAVLQSGGHTSSIESTTSSRPATPKHISREITVNSVQRKDKRTKSPSSMSSGSDDTYIQRNTRSSSLRKKSSGSRTPTTTTPHRPSPEMTPVLGRRGARRSPSLSRTQKSSHENAGQMNKTSKSMSPKHSGTSSSAPPRRPIVQRTLSGSLPGSSATIGHCRTSAGGSPQVHTIKKSKSVGNISSMMRDGRRTPTSTPSSTPKHNPGGGLKTICVEITMERRKSLDRNSLSSNVSVGERPRSASRQSSRTSNCKNTAPSKTKQKTDSLERSRQKTDSLERSRQKTDSLERSRRKTDSLERPRLKTDSLDRTRHTDSLERRVCSAPATMTRTNPLSGAKPKSGILRNPSPKAERHRMNLSSSALRDFDSLTRSHARARSVDPAVRIVKTMSVRECSPSPKMSRSNVKRSQSMERHNSRDSTDGYVSKQKQAWEEKSTTTVITTVTEITRVRGKKKDPKTNSNRKSALISQRQEMFDSKDEATSPTKSLTKSLTKSPTKSPKKSPTKVVHKPPLDTAGTPAKPLRNRLVLSPIRTSAPNPPPQPPPHQKSPPLQQAQAVLSPQRARSPERVRSPDKPSLPEKPPGLRQTFKSRLAATEKAAKGAGGQMSGGNQSDDESYSRSNVVAKRNSTGAPSARPQSCIESILSKPRPPKPPPPPRRDIPPQEQKPVAPPVTIPATRKQQSYSDVPFIDDPEDDVFKNDAHNACTLPSNHTLRPMVLQENQLKYPTQSNIISRYDEVDSAQNTTSPTKENDVFHTPLIDADSQEKWAMINQDLNASMDVRKSEIIMDNRELDVSSHERTSGTTTFEGKTPVEATNNNLVVSDDVDKCGNHSMGQNEEKDGHYFLRVVNGEHARIEAVCQAVEKDLEQEIPEDASGKIRAAIGKASLLTTKKFKQFRGLCEQNLTQSGDEAFCTTNTDLAGFWDMVMIQVEDVNQLFVEIEELKRNGWKSPVIVRAKHKKQLDGLEIMACMSSLLLANYATSDYNAVGTDSHTASGDALTGQLLSTEETQQLCRSSGRKRTTSSSTKTPPPSPSPSSVTTPLKWSAAPPQPDPKAKSEREKKAAKARQAREEARRRLIAAKRAARQRAKSVDKQENDTAVEIFVPESS